MRTRIPHLAPVVLAITIATGCGNSPGGPAAPVAGPKGVAQKKAHPRPGRAGKKAVPEPVPEVSPTLFFD